MAGHTAGRLFSGLVLGAAVGATVALVLSSRASVALPRSGMPGKKSGPTPFEPANAVIDRARHLVDEVRGQVRMAVEEGRATAAQTRAELTNRFEAAKRGELHDQDRSALPKQLRLELGKRDTDGDGKT